MRRSRRGGHLGADFPSSGEDSFVAVVVTKLTGALLFILLLTMVIMALLPRAVDIESQKKSAQADEPPIAPLAITTPDNLPEAIVGRPYTLALAASGGKAALKWHLEGELPAGLSFHSDKGLLQGTPSKATPAPVELLVHVTDGASRDTSLTHLTIYQPATTLSLPSTWKPSLPPIPLRDWLQHGFGFLLLILVHSVGMSTLNNLQYRLEATVDPNTPDSARAATRRRLSLYRMGLRLLTLAAMVALALWIARPPASSL